MWSGGELSYDKLLSILTLLAEGQGMRPDLEPHLISMRHVQREPGQGGCCRRNILPQRFVPGRVNNPKRSQALARLDPTW